jgi:predicted DNA-binding transcriptional regulator AlpA
MLRVGSGPPQLRMRGYFRAGSAEHSFALDIEMAASFGCNDPDTLLHEVQAADFLCFSARTLQGWRLNGTGPKYVRAGRAIRYRRRDLIDWIEENTVSKARSAHASEKKDASDSR